MFNERLREKRDKIGISQRKFAQKIGVSSDLYNKYEQGVSRPSYETLVILTQELNTTTDWLLTGKEPHERSNKEGDKIMSERGFSVEMAKEGVVACLHFCCKYNRDDLGVFSTGKVTLLNDKIEEAAKITQPIISKERLFEIAKICIGEGTEKSIPTLLEFRKLIVAFGKKDNRDIEELEWRLKREQELLETSSPQNKKAAQINSAPQ